MTKISSSNKDIGKRIKKLRLDHGLNQERFGEMLGISKGGVSRWESGNTTPNASRLKLISEKFGVSVEYLLHGSLMPDMKKIVLDTVIYYYCEADGFDVTETNGETTTWYVTEVIDRYLYSRDLISDYSDFGGPNLYDGYIDEDTGEPLPTLYAFFKHNIPLFDDDGFINSLDHSRAFFESNKGLAGDDDVIIPRFCSALEDKTDTTKFYTKRYPLYVYYDKLSKIITPSKLQIGKAFIAGNQPKAKKLIAALIDKLKQFNDQL